MSETVKFGQVGFGAWGKIHAGAVSGTEGAALAAISARSAETRAEAAVAYPEAEIYEDWRDLVAREDLDVVDVVVPSFLHHEIAKAVLESGKHLMLEKPMCLSVADCDELIGIAEEKGRLLSIMHELRLSSLWGEMKRLVDEGVLGEPQYLMMELSRHPYRQGADGWRYDIKRVGSWVLEEPIHFFDLARWYFSEIGNPSSVSAVANSKEEGRPELRDNFSATMRWETGAFAVICQTLSAFEHHQSMKLTGTKGSLWARWSGAQDRTYHPEFSLKVFDGEEVRDATPEKVTGEVFEIQDHMAMLVKAIRGEGELTSTGEDGMWSVAMCLAADAAVERGVEVRIEEILKS
jgi:myo-inositol 2-dehydrogenase/D-chiro-inositol 1-dehydrogenase